MERLTYSVPEISQLLGISIPRAYDLAHSEGFPVIHVGKRMIVPVESFHKWLEESAEDGLKIEAGK
jgi:excisionase family DNA binding protein